MSTFIKGKKTISKVGEKYPPNPSPCLPSLVMNICVTVLHVKVTTPSQSLTMTAYIITTRVDLQVWESLCIQVCIHLVNRIACTYKKATKQSQGNIMNISYNVGKHTML